MAWLQIRGDSGSEATRVNCNQTPSPRRTNTIRIQIDHEDDEQHCRPTKKRRKRRHVPHHERPLEAVIKRNERERRRVDDVNGAFKRLQTHLPRACKSHRRVSKMAILQHAIEYISELR